MKQLEGTAKRIADQVAKHEGVTSIGLVAGDLRLAFQTVKRYVTAMIREGYLQRGEDGNALELTDTYRAERAFNAEADRLFKRCAVALEVS